MQAAARDMIRLHVQTIKHQLGAMSHFSGANESRDLNQGSRWVSRTQELGERQIVSALAEREAGDLKSGSFSIERFALILTALNKIQDYEPSRYNYHNDPDGDESRYEKFRKHCKIELCADIALECFEQLRAASIQLPVAERDLAAIIAYRISEGLAKNAGNDYLLNPASSKISMVSLRLAELVGLPQVQTIPELLETLNAPNQLSPLARCGVWLCLHSFQKSLITESCSGREEDYYLKLDAAAVYALKAAHAASELVQSPPLDITMLSRDRLKKLESRIKWGHTDRALAELSLPPRYEQSGEAKEWSTLLLMKAVDLVVKESESGKSMHRAMRALNYVTPFVAELSPRNFSRWVESCRRVVRLSQELGEYEVALDLCQKLDSAISQKVTTVEWTAESFHKELSSGPIFTVCKDLLRWLDSVPRPWRKQDNPMLMSRQDTVRKLISQSLDSVDQKQQECLFQAEREWKTLARQCWREARHSRYMSVESLLDLVDGHLQCLPDAEHESFALDLWVKARRMMEKFDHEPLVEYLACWCRWTEIGCKFDSDEVFELIKEAHEDNRMSWRRDLHPCRRESVNQEVSQAISEKALEVLYQMIVAESHLDESAALGRIHEYHDRYQSADLATQNSYPVYHNWINSQELSVSLLIKKMERAPTFAEKSHYIAEAQKVVVALREVSESNYSPFVKSALKICSALISLNPEGAIPTAARQLWNESSEKLSTYLEKVGKREHLGYYVPPALELLYEWSTQVMMTGEPEWLPEVERRFTNCERHLRAHLVYYETASGYTDQFRFDGSDDSFAVIEFDDGTSSMCIDRLKGDHLKHLDKLAHIRIQMGEDFHNDAAQATDSLLAHYQKYFAADADLEFSIKIYERVADLYEQCEHFPEAIECQSELEKLYRQRQG